MTDPVQPLVLDLLEWLADEPRPYAEVMEIWRTSCPRLPVWEEANARGFVERRHEVGSEAQVMISAAGAEHLRAHRATPSQTARDRSADQSGLAAVARTQPRSSMHALKAGS